MKDFINKIKTGISKYYETFSANTRQYLKINAVALIIIVAVIATLIGWLWPSEKNIDQQVYVKNTELSQNYDERSNSVIDTHKEALLQMQLNEIKSSREKYKIFKVIFYSLILTVLTGMLATLLQAVYTKLKFTNNQESSHRVLSAALFSSAVIVCVVFVIIYFPIAAAAF